jgi:hypothetical protein
MVAAIVIAISIVAEMTGVRVCFDKYTHRVSCYVSHDI